MIFPKNIFPENRLPIFGIMLWSDEQQMTELAPVHDSLPRWVPALLSFVAGYVDSYTFLALFGLFVAQVTGSFVTAGAQFVVHDIGIAGKVIAILAFLVATALTAALIGLIRDRGRDAFSWMLALETLLLAVFCFLMLAGPPVDRSRSTGTASSPAYSGRWRWARRASSCGC